MGMIRPISGPENKKFSDGLPSAETTSQRVAVREDGALGGPMRFRVPRSLS